MPAEREKQKDNRAEKARRNQLFRVPRRLARGGRMRWTMIALFVAAVALVLPKDFIPEFSYEKGKTWVAPSLKAEFEFPLYKPEAELADEREQVLREVPPVFEQDTAARTQALDNTRQAVDAFFDRLLTYQAALRSGADSVAELREAFLLEYRLDPDQVLTRHGRPGPWQRAFVLKAETFIDEVYAAGYIDTVKANLPNGVIYVRKSDRHLVQKDLTLEEDELVDFLAEEVTGLTQEETRMFRELVFPAMRPSLSYSESLTQHEKDRVAGLVSPVYSMVRKGETIISKGERVGDIHDLKIRSYLRAREARFGRPPFLVTLSGQLVMVLIVTALLILFIRNNRPRIFFSDRKLALVLLIFLTMVGVVVLVLKLTLFTQEIVGLNYIFLVPACMVPIILSAFFDTRFAFFGNIIIAVFAGSIVPNGFEYFFVQLWGGTAAVYSLTRLRNRADFFISLSLIFLAYVVTYIGYNFYTKGSFTSIEYINLALFGLNVLLTFITYPLIYVFEKLFGLTSDLTFIELLDTNHPLLKELSVRAPGTFQHSIQVANIAESVLNRIGGNSLQAKVGALFHDIGKMKNPLFFIENLADQQSPHEKLGYEESAEKIIAHVPDGVKLAQEYNLPTEVIDFIRTHHGTTRTEFFYRKCVEDNPDEEVDVFQFQYPGPLPFTREMAVLMIADSIEAASRAMKDRSPEKLLSLVENIVDSKVRQRQFNKAYLTFRDLEEAKEVVYNMLVSIYHGRIEYPEEPPAGVTGSAAQEIPLGE